MSSANLHGLFSPASLAVIGASRDPQKVGHIVFKNILESGYTGLIFPINPSGEAIEGKKAYNNYGQTPVCPELAIIAVPAAVAVGLLGEVAQRGTKNVVILSAGFKEIGEEGRALEEALLAAAKKYSLTILGPNCLGFVNNALPLNATFGTVAPGSGNLRFISQSGAIATSVFDWSRFTGATFSDFITLGNKSIVDEVDVLRYWLHQAKTKHSLTPKSASVKGLSQYRPIGMYLESITRGQEFLELATQLNRIDPVFVLKPGRSRDAQKAMSSHTGAIASDDAILDAALKNAGIIRCAGAEDWFDIARAFAWENAPQGRNVAIVSNAGGPAVITTDAVTQAGLTMAPLSAQTHKILQEKLPRFAALNNPIDVLGDALADRYKAALTAVLEEKSVDAVVVILTPQVMTQIKETAQVIGELSLAHHKTIVASFMGGTAIEAGEIILNNYRIPSFRFPERAVAALAIMQQWEAHRQMVQEAPSRTVALLRTALQTELTERAQKEHRKVLSNADAQKFVAEAGVPTPPSQLVRSEREAVEAATVYGYPVVLKISSAALLHKTEAGGVIVNVHNEAAVRRAFLTLSKKMLLIRGHHGADAAIEVQKQILDAQEVIVGFKRDPSFGAVCLFGAGGTLAELLTDRNLALLPLDVNRAKKLVEAARVYPLLHGFRGASPYALSALYSCMVQLALLFAANPEIAELEINPIMVTKSGVWAADARIILS